MKAPLADVAARHLGLQAAQRIKINAIVHLTTRFAVLLLVLATGSHAVVSSNHPWHQFHSHRSLQQSSSQSDPDVQEACIRTSLRSMKFSCAYNGTAFGDGANSSVKSTSSDGLVRALQNCLGGNLTAQGAKPLPVRVLVGTSATSQVIAAAAGSYSNVTGIPVRVDMVGFREMTAVRGASMGNASNLPYTHEVWIPSISQLAEGARDFMDLTKLVGLDRRLNWSDLAPVLQSSALSIKSKVIGLPLNLHTYHMAYDKEVVTKYNLPVPRTWDELLTYAKRYNGTDGMHGFCALWGKCFSFGTGLIRMILATYTQTHGPLQGWLYEPESMKLLLDSAAMTETLDILRELYLMSPPDESAKFGCPVYSYMFSSRQCIYSMIHPIVFKYNANTAQPGKLYGRLGIAPFPGSDRVLDPATDTVVPCTEQRCPYASRHTREDGTTFLVNEAPPIDLSIISLNAYTPPELSFFTFKIISTVTSRETSDYVVYQPSIDSLPVYMSQLDVKRWVAAGFNYNDSLGYVTDALRMLRHPNLELPLRNPGASGMYALFTEAANTLMFNNAPTADVVQLLATKGAAILNKPFGGNMTAVKFEYWDSINRNTDVLRAPNTVGSVDSKATNQDDNEPLSRTQLLQIILPVVLGTCALAAVAMWVMRTMVKATSWGRVSHPGPGFRTTMLVTDIENSTTLWEQLDAAIVDASVKLHNSCIRTLAAKHQGYESVWEGDSFIIVFPTPQLAVKFAVVAQQELMQLPWPAGLLASELANEIWVQPVKSKGLRHAEHETGATEIAGPMESLMSMISASPSAGSLPREKLGSHTQDSLLSETSINPSATSPRADRLQTFGQRLKAQWLVCPPKTTGAVCAFRGLRVRMGMHSSVASSADIQYNALMRRYHYTGPIRVTSNAVASAGHGGHIMLSGTSASLLGMNGAGALTDLPSDCHVYHMGLHVLSGVDQPTDMVLILPAALKSRMAVQQDALRSVECMLPGVLSSPKPAADMKMTMVAVSVCGLDSLLSWNKDITNEALREVLACFHAVISTSGGYVSEDGWSVVLATGKTKAPVTAAYPDAVVPGRVVVAFTMVQDAMAFAQSLREQLLQLDWDAQLLEHPLCERMGEAPDRMSAQRSSFKRAISGVSSSTASKAEPAHLTFAVEDFTEASEQASEGVNEQVANLRQPSSKQQALDKSNLSISDTSSIHASSRQKSKSGLAKALPAMTSSKKMPGRTGVAIFEAPYLRGLRTRTVVAQGHVTADVALGSSGRAVFAGSAARQLAQLHMKVKAGCIIVPLKLVQGMKTDRSKAAAGGPVVPGAQQISYSGTV